MSLINSTAIPSGATGYELEQSLRFDDGRTTCLTRTPASASNRKTFTFSAWVKRGHIGVQQTLMSVNNGSDNSTILHIYLASDNEITISFQAFTLTTTPLLRDTSAWYHIMFVADTTQVAEANRFKIYLNGTQLTLGSSGTFISQNTDLAFNQATQHSIGRRDNDNDRYFDGYLGEVNFIDGLAKAPADFGKTGDYGEWKPIEYSGSYGTNGFYLPFKQDYTVEGFSAVTYRGEGGSRYVGGVGFQPDFVWIKRRNGNGSHRLTDAVRGAGVNSSSDDTGAEATGNNCSAFHPDGFTNGGNSDDSGDSYVVWNWDMGGSNATNTEGSITSTVRASTTYGQSIVTYTGTGSVATVGHGLDSAPNMVIVKNRNNSGGDWKVQHTGLSDGAKVVYLNSTMAESTESDKFGVFAGATTFPLNGSHASVNGNGDTYLAYCFHSVTGYSKFGSYTGNGSANHAITGLGFKPAFLLIKRINSAHEWVVVDNVRNYQGNQTPSSLLANTYAAETNQNGDDVTSLDADGFKVGVNGRTNGNNDTFIYMAFADTREYAYWLDQSGNNNDWTSNNLTESDISVDSPTNNFATWNAVYPPNSARSASFTLAEGNLQTTSVGNGSKFLPSTMNIPATGKWYMELYVKSIGNGGNYANVGFL